MASPIRTALFVRHVFTSYSNIIVHLRLIACVSIVLFIQFVFFCCSLHAVSCFSASAVVILWVILQFKEFISKLYRSWDCG